MLILEEQFELYLCSGGIKLSKSTAAMEDR